VLEISWKSCSGSRTRGALTFVQSLHVTDVSPITTAFIFSRTMNVSSSLAILAAASGTETMPKKVWKAASSGKTSSAMPSYAKSS
jgi:hypothetical protein